MTTNTITPTGLSLVERALAVLGPDKSTEFIDGGGCLDDQGYQSDEHQLAAEVLHAEMVAAGARTANPKAHHRITLGYFRATAVELFGRRNGSPDRDLAVECPECERTTWVDTTCGLAPTPLAIMQGALPDDEFYEDRCGWCGAEVSA